MVCIKFDFSSVRIIESTLIVKICFWNFSYKSHKTISSTIRGVCSFHSLCNGRKIKRSELWVKFLLVFECPHTVSQLCYTYRSTDHFLSPIPVSDWLTFSCGNSILHQKRNENYKNTNFLMKSSKKCQESICKYKVAFFTVTRPSDSQCNMLEI